MCGTSEVYLWYLGGVLGVLGPAGGVRRVHAPLDGQVLGSPDAYVSLEVRKQVRAPTVEEIILSEKEVSFQAGLEME